MPKPPNILFLWTDQQRFDTLAVGGNTKIQMPNLNRLSENSTAFTHAYCTQPICTPSRGSIMSGLFPHAHGAVWNNLSLKSDVKTLPEWLPNGTYATGYMGKWHLGNEHYSQHGFEEWISIEDRYNEFLDAGHKEDIRSHYHRWLESNGIKPKDGNTFTRGETARLSEEWSRPAFLAKHASDFIRKHRNHPFVLSVNFLEPHPPIFSPRNEQHDPADITLRANVGLPPTEEQPLFLHQRHHDQGFARKTSEDWKNTVRRYWGMCSLVDTHAGTILNTLEDEGLFDNTLIVYTSDHGDQLGSHGLSGKQVLFDESIHIPLLIKCPGQRTGQLIHHRTSQIDLIPTLLNVLDVDVPSPLHGTSRRGWLDGNKNSPPDDVFVVWDGMSQQPKKIKNPHPSKDKGENQRSRTILTPDGWRFTWAVHGVHELYDLNSDPFEMTNLATRPEFQKQTSELIRRIKTWQSKVGDTFDANTTLTKTKCLS